MNTEVRSAEAAGLQLGLWPDADAPAATHQPGVHQHGVGGRRRPGPVRRRGGGYLDGRTASELRNDPRLRELEEIGLREHWIEVAALIGFDAFIAMWQHLSRLESLRDDSNQMELRLRPFSSYERYQRNRYIETLVASGLNVREVYAEVRNTLQWPLTITQVRRQYKRAKHGY